MILQKNGVFFAPGGSSKYLRKSFPQKFVTETTVLCKIWRIKKTVFFKLMGWEQCQLLYFAKNLYNRLRVCKPVLKSVRKMSNIYTGKTNLLPNKQPLTNKEGSSLTDMYLTINDWIRIMIFLSLLMAKGFNLFWMFRGGVN